MSNSAISLSGPIGPAQYRNKLINGSFDVWQRGNTFGTAADGTTAGGILDCYTVDRWICRDSAPSAWTETGTGAAAAYKGVFNPTQIAVPGYPTNYLRYVMKNSNGGLPSILQRIEDVRTCAGKSVTVSFYAKASGITGEALPVTTSLPIEVEIMQFLGMDEDAKIGSRSCVVQGATGAFGSIYAEGHHRLVKRKAVDVYTAGWKKYEVKIKLESLEGMTLGIDKTNWTDTDTPFNINYLNQPGHFLQLALRLPGSVEGVREFSGTGTAGSYLNDNWDTEMKYGYTLDVALVQLEQSDSSTEFEFRGYDQELFMCSRYFQRSLYGFNKGAAAGSFGSVINFVPKLRVVPVPVRKSHIAGRKSENTSVNYPDPLSPDYGLDTGVVNDGGTNDAFYGGTVVTRHGFVPSLESLANDSAAIAVMDFDAEIVTGGDGKERFISNQSLSNSAYIGHYGGAHTGSTRRMGGGQDDASGYYNIST